MEQRQMNLPIFVVNSGNTKRNVAQRLWTYEKKKKPLESLQCYHILIWIKEIGMVYNTQQKISADMSDWKSLSFTYSPKTPVGR